MKFKKIFMVMLSLMIFLSSSMSVDALYLTNDISDSINDYGTVYDAMHLRSINPVRYRKENVTKTTEYSRYQRASKSVGKGFKVSVDRTVSFSITLIGAEGLFNLGNSVSYSDSYSVTNNAYKSGYIGCRAVYEVEKGTRVIYDATNGKILGKNKYVVKKPKTFHYELLQDK